MHHRTTPAASANSHLPASILFKPRDLKQYSKWQKLCTALKPSQQGYLPTALEYDDFNLWRGKQDSGYFSDVFEDIAGHIKATCADTPTSPCALPLASLCQHPLHPAAKKLHLARCPSCLVEMHLAYMKLLHQRLQEVVGRPLPRTGTPSELQEHLHSAWTKGKVAALNQVQELERMVTKEEKWSQKKKDIPQGDFKSARHALDLYWFETSGYYMHDVTFGKEKNKKVLFSEDTDFNNGRRPELYWRKSPRYEPGKYAMPDGQLDDSCAISDDSEDYSQSSLVVADGTQDQPRLLIVGWEDDEEDVDDWEDIDSDNEVEEEENIDDDENDDSSFASYIEDASDLIIFEED